MTAVIIPIYGGLGNQMFQVAHGLSFTRRHELVPQFVDFTPFTGRVSRIWELDCFAIEQCKLTRSQIGLLRLRLFASLWFQRFNSALHLGVLYENSTIHSSKLHSMYKVCSGYWQGEQYFNNNEDFIRNIFTFPEFILPKALINVDKEIASVAVHVRRGDYISDPVSRAYHYVCNVDWYLHAMKEMRNRLHNPKFYIFSDDQTWATAVFGNIPDVSFVDSNTNGPAWMDMALMTKCSNFIISNSTYSWWASYLGKKINSITIAPQYWYPGLYTKELNVMRKDWILI